MILFLQILGRDRGGLLFRDASFSDFTPALLNGERHRRSLRDANFYFGISNRRFSYGRSFLSKTKRIFSLNAFQNV